MAGKNVYMMTVAIDFGTTFSGYAFQMNSEYVAKDPTLNIRCPQSWNHDKVQLISHKTPTCLLLDQNQDIDSFGYEAEDKYTTLQADDDHINWYYFRRFKMTLHKDKKLSRATKLEDVLGKEMPAVDVFSKSIQCLKEHLEGLLTRSKVHVNKDEIQWVITVPAIWDDSAKLFMRQAAESAGIAKAHLSIALEPEAASLYCQYLPVEKFTMGGQVKFSDAKPGTTYMIVDLGGGTADIALHEKISTGKLKEVHKASGGPWGGTAVDREFITLLCDIVGGPTFNVFMKKQTHDYLDLMRDFELLKRNIGQDTTDEVKVKLPVSLNETCISVVRKDFAALIVAAKKSEQVSLSGDKIKIKANIAKNLFKKATNKIVQHIRKILETPPGRRVKLILMVGGFSESRFVQDVIKDEFHDKRGMKVLVPNEPGIAVLKGAVVYGKHPENIASRILRYTYGAEVTNEFEPGIHQRSYQYTDDDGKEMCGNLFGKFIEVGTEVQTGHIVSKTYDSSHKFQTGYDLSVYTSPDSDPEYTDDEDCRQIGHVYVKIPQPSEKVHELKVKYVFGDTELHVTAADETSHTPCKVTFTLPE